MYDFTYSKPTTLPDAVKLLSDDMEAKALAPADFQRGSHSNGGSILFGLLLATALGFAISSHHGSSGSSSSSTGTSTTTTPGVPNPPTLTGGGSGSPPNPPATGG